MKKRTPDKKDNIDAHKATNEVFANDKGILAAIQTGLIHFVVQSVCEEEGAEQKEARHCERRT